MTANEVQAHLAFLNRVTDAEMAGVGVRRVSVGAAFAKATYKAFETVAERLKTDGRLP